jgi:hypothetical protein
VSYIPPSQLEGINLVVQFIIEYRGKGHFLPYDDHQIVKNWLTLCASPESLLLALSDIIPDFYQKHSSKQFPPSLSRINKKVTNLLQAKALREKY